MRASYNIYICGPGEVGPQCGYVSDLASFEYGPKDVPMHTHRNPEGTWRETAWGPLVNCLEGKAKEEDPE